MILTLWLVRMRAKLEDMGRVYVEDETIASEAPPAVEPA